MILSLSGRLDCPSPHVRVCPGLVTLMVLAIFSWLGWIFDLGYLWRGASSLYQSLSVSLSLFWSPVFLSLSQSLAVTPSLFQSLLASFSLYWSLPVPHSFSQSLTVSPSPSQNSYHNCVTISVGGYRCIYSNSSNFTQPRHSWYELVLQASPSRGVTRVWKQRRHMN